VSSNDSATNIICIGNISIASHLSKTSWYPSIRLSEEVVEDQLVLNKPSK